MPFRRAAVSSAYDAQPTILRRVEPDTQYPFRRRKFGVGSLQSRATSLIVYYCRSWGQPEYLHKTDRNYLHPTSLIGGGLDLNRSGPLPVYASYHGGETFIMGYQQNMPYHDLSVSQDIAWGVGVFIS